MKGEFLLALLPRTEAVRPDEYGHRAALPEKRFKGGLPSLPWDQVPAVEKDLEAAFSKGVSHLLDQWTVAPAVAHEEAVTLLRVVHPERLTRLLFVV